MVKNILTYRLSFLHKALLLLGLFLALGTTNAVAQFAVSEDFRGSGNPDIIIGDDAILTSGNGDPVNAGWLRLTPSTTYKKGYAYVNKTFPSSLGVLVDFEFKMWRNANADGADGIGVYLYDGTSTPFTLGAYGGSLGYAGNPGLKGGYVGIGLDAYGNFSNPTEGRNGGPGVRANAVILRGPTTAVATTTNPFLAGTTINYNSGTGVFTYGNVTTTTNNDRTQNVLDYNTTVTTRPTDATYYRRIQIEIERLLTGGQYKITVRWKTSTTSTTFTDITSYITTDVPPALLKLGFAASTGGDINFHEIRNLLVTTPNNMRVKKTANKDFIRTVAGTGSENQITYTIEVTNDTPDPVFNVDFVDKITDADGNAIPKYNATLVPNGFEITSVTSTGFASGSASVGFLNNDITGTFSMAANAVGIITVKGVLHDYTPSGNVVINTATATPPFDDDLNNNTSVVNTPVLAEGIDFVPMYSVNENCADGSNTFTLNISNNGVASAAVVASGGNKLRLTIRVPRNNGGYSNTMPESATDPIPAGWKWISSTNTSGPNARTYVFESTQAATMASGSAYNYPFVFTENKTSPFTTYTTVASIQYLNNGGSDIEPNAATDNNSSSIDIVAVPTAPVAPNVYYCQGETAVPLTATTTDNTYVLKWYFAASGGFSSDYAPTPQTDVPGTLSYWVTQTKGTCEGPRTQISVFITPTATAGSIAADQYYCSGTVTPAKLTNVTSGSVSNATGVTPTMSYKWQVSTDNTTWTDIGSSNSFEYQPPSISATRYYRRITLATNGSKICQSPPTNVVTVAISAAPTAGTIAANQTICYGDTPALLTSSTVGTGTGTIAYAWQSSINSGTSWSADIGGAVNATYQPGALTQTTQFRRYTVATNGTAICRSAAATPVVTITVQGQINPGTVGSDQTICNGATPAALTSGSAATVTAPTLPSTGITYRWEYSTDSGATWTTAPGTATNTTYTFPAGIAATRYYRRVAIATGTGKTCETPTNNIIITVQAVPTVGSITAPSPTTVCYGSTVAIGSGGAGTGSGTITYRWEAGGTTISGETGPTLTINNITATTTYRRFTVSTLNGVNCEAGPTNAVTITVLAAVTAGSITADQTICYNTAPSQIGSGTNGTGAGTITYAWQSSTDSGGTWSADISGATGQNYTPLALTVTTLYRRFTVSTSTGPIVCRSAATAPVTITVSALPQAGTVAANQTICFNTTPALFTSAAGGAGSGSGVITYQWYISSDNTNFNQIGGANSETYQETSNLSSNRYYRRVTISTLNGKACQSAVSNTITVTVADFIQPGNLAGGDTYVCSGSVPSTISSGGAGVVSSPGVVSYAWQSSTDNGVTWSTDIVGATSANYSPGALTQTTIYRRYAIGTYAGTPNTVCRSQNPTNQIRVNVVPIATGGTIGNDQTVCSGSVPPQTIDVTAGTNANQGYAWQVSTDNVTWTDIAGATNPVYQPTAAITQTTYYRRFGVSNNGGTLCRGTSPSNTITMTVPATATPGTIGSDQNVCGNAIPALFTSVTAGAGGSSYQWQYSGDGSSGWTNIAGATSATYQAGVATYTLFYRRLMINNTCPSAGSNVIKITVTTYPNSGSISADQSICAGTTPATITGDTGWAGGGTASYKWYSSPDGTTWTYTGVTTQNYTFSGALASTTYYRRGLTSSPCYGEVFSNTVTITVSPAPTGGTVAVNQTICSGTTPVALTSGAAGSTTNYRWDSSPNGTAWTSTGVTTAGYTFPGALTATTYYRRATIAASCSGEAYSNTITITVNPAPTGGTVAANQTICNGTAPAALTSSVAGSSTTYRWDVSTDNVAWSSTGVTTAGYAPGTLTATRYYRRASILGSCEGYSNTITITVVAAPTGGTVAADQTICYNATPATLTSSVAGTGAGGFTYRWDVSPNGSTGWVSTGVTTATYSPGALTVTQYYRRTTIPTAGSCESYSNTITITVLSQTTAGALTANQSICKDSAPSQIGPGTAGTGSGTLTYRWESSPDGTTWTVIAGATSAAYTPPVIHATTYYRRTTISTTGAVVCESVATGTVIVTTRRCYVTTNPHIQQKVKS